MSLMLPTPMEPGALQPVLRKRRFRLDLSCAMCDQPETVVMTLMDELDDPATESDIFATGALDRMKFRCKAPGCDCECAILISVAYLPDPNEARGSE